MRTSKSSKSWNCKAKLCAPRQSDLSLWLLLEWLVLLLSWTHENKLPSQTWPSALTNLTVSGSHGWHEVGMSSVATPIAACNQIWFQHHSDKKMNRHFDFAHACLGFSTSCKPYIPSFPSVVLSVPPPFDLPRYFCRDFWILGISERILETEPTALLRTLIVNISDIHIYIYRFQGLWLHKCQHQNHIKSQTQWAKTGCVLHPVYHEFAVTMLAVLQRSVWKSGQGTSFAPSLPAVSETEWCRAARLFLNKVRHMP